MLIITPEGLQLILYIDTTTKKLLLTIFDKESKIIDQLEWETEINHTKELLVQVDNLLKRNGILKSELKAVTVNGGPGPFTGVRVGVTTANLLAFGLNIPVFALKSSGSQNLKKTFRLGLAHSGFTIPVFPLYDRSPHITKKTSR